MHLETVTDSFWIASGRGAKRYFMPADVDGIVRRGNRAISPGDLIQ